jgi:predicted kinase
VQTTAKAPTRFIVVCGPPCAGKSTVAAQLASALNAPCLAMDRFRERLLPRSMQTVADRDLAYRAMHLTAELLAPWCPTVVLDATYTAGSCRSELVSLVQRAEGEMSLLECHVGPAVAVERFLRRGDHPAVDLDVKRVAALAESYPYFSAAYAVEPTEAADLAGGRLHPGGPLHPEALAAWCRRGLPRETQPELASVDA